MRCGLWLFPGGAVQDLVDAVVEAESIGLDEIWLGDEGPAGWDPFIVLTAAALRTSQIRLGVGVANPLTRHPGATALAAVTLNEISGGRVTLGYGRGGSFPLDPFGIPTQSSTIGDVVQALHVTRAVSRATSGPGYLVPPSPVASPTLRLAVGSRGPKTNAAASGVADAAFFSGLAWDAAPSLATLARSVAPIDIHWYRTVANETGPLSLEGGTISGELAHVVSRAREEAHQLQAVALGLALWGGSPIEQVRRAGPLLVAEKEA